VVCVHSVILWATPSLSEVTKTNRGSSKTLRATKMAIPQALPATNTIAVDCAPGALGAVQHPRNARRSAVHLYHASTVNAASPRAAIFFIHTNTPLVYLHPMRPAA
jgi:hypothetical protein